MTHKYSVNEWVQKLEELMREAEADGVTWDYVEEPAYGGCACSTGPQYLYALRGEKYLPRSFKPNPHYEEVKVEIY